MRFSIDNCGGNWVISFSARDENKTAKQLQNKKRWEKCILWIITEPSTNSRMSVIKSWILSLHFLMCRHSSFHYYSTINGQTAIPTKLLLLLLLASCLPQSIQIFTKFIYLFAFTYWLMRMFIHANENKNRMKILHVINNNSAWLADMFHTSNVKEESKWVIFSVVFFWTFLAFHKIPFHPFFINLIPFSSSQAIFSVPVLEIFFSKKLLFTFILPIPSVPFHVSLSHTFLYSFD